MHIAKTDFPYDYALHPWKPIVWSYKNYFLNFVWRIHLSMQVATHGAIPVHRYYNSLPEWISLYVCQLADVNIKW